MFLKCKPSRVKFHTGHKQQVLPNRSMISRLSVEIQTTRCNYKSKVLSHLNFIPKNVRSYIAQSHVLTINNSLFFKHMVHRQRKHHKSALEIQYDVTKISVLKPRGKMIITADHKCYPTCHLNCKIGINYVNLTERSTKLQERNGKSTYYKNYLVSGVSLQILCHKTENSTSCAVLLLSTLGFSFLSTRDTKSFFKLQGRREDHHQNKYHRKLGNIVTIVLTS